MEKKPLEEETTKGLELELGRDVRRIRLHQDLTQQELARDANISLSALKGLEAGHGSGIRTLIRVARALGRTDWLESFAPREPSISPMQMLRERQKENAREPQRASGLSNSRTSE